MLRWWCDTGAQCAKCLGVTCHPSHKVPNCVSYIWWKEGIYPKMESSCMTVGHGDQTLLGQLGCKLRR